MIKDIEELTTAEEARQFAMGWQEWQATQSLSYSELAMWQEIFQGLANEFNLQDEFKENGII